MLKFQMNTIKHMSKAVRPPKYYIDGNDILIIFDGFRAVRIPKCLFYLDISYMGELTQLKSYLSKNGDETPCFKTTHIIQHGKMMIRKFKGLNGDTRYINEKFLKDMIFKDYDFYFTEDGLLCCKGDIPIEFIFYVDYQE